MNTLNELFRAGVFNIIKADLSKLDKPTLKNGIRIYLFPKGTVFRYDVWFRLTQWARLTKFRKYTFGIVAYLFMRHYEYKYGIHLNANIYVGKGLHIMHGDGVHLNASYIGENFTVYQGTTVGSKKGGIPLIEDNVTIYANSVVIGEIILHNNSSVGAQSFCDKNVYENECVAGCPAVCIKRN